MMRRVARAIVILAGLCVGCSDHRANTPSDAALVDVPGEPMPREVITESVVLVVNELTEAVLVGGPNDYARITMSAQGAPLDWNLHGHANGETQVVQEQLKVASVDYVFVPPAQGDWYLLLRNKGQADITVQLQIKLFGELTWSGWL